MDAFSKFLTFFHLKKEMTLKDLDDLHPFISWYAFERTGPSQSVINFDHKSSLEINDNRLSHSAKGEIFFTEKHHVATHYLEFLKVHHKNILVALDKTKQELSKYSPETSAHEASEWEWFRVSMQIAKESIKNFNPLTSSLEYKLFAGKISENAPFVIRVIYYNLDIVFEIGDTFFYRVKDNKGTDDKSKHVIKEAPIPSLYNDFLNTLIEFLQELKNTELKILTIDDES